jgi:BirA family transcriptional regulator, biotin operon repressor / biotin---[acetyl-CoA-carboxylase] ligase
MSDDLVTALTASESRLGIFAGRVRWYDEVGSTNDLVQSWADAGGAEGLAAIADAQTNGRGRLGRRWSSPAGAGIYLSALLRPSRSVLPLLTIAAGVAVADAMQSAAGLAVALKWPNDVCVEAGTGRWLKVAGILAESGTAASSGANYAIVGMGINVRTAIYPSDVAPRATSLEAELGRVVDRSMLVVECLCALSSRYEQLKGGGEAQILSEWRRRASATLGRPVEFGAAGSVSRGVAQGIDESGALLVRMPEGMRRIVSGEVRWL